MNVEQFAQELKLSSGLLLEQLRAAGVNKSAAGDAITEQDKARLLDYLSKKHGATDMKSKITLTRKETTEIKKSDSTGKARTIQVEVRKKRVLIKREMPMVSEVIADAEIASESLPVSVDEVEVQAPVVAEMHVEAEQPIPVTAEEAVEAPVATVEVDMEAMPAAEKLADMPIEPPAEEIAEVADEPASLVAAAQDSPEATPAQPVLQRRRIVRPVLDDQELARRAEEVRRHSALHERQAEEIRIKQERESKRKQVIEEQALAVEAAKNPPPAEVKPVVTEGTLHKAPPKPGEKPKPVDKKPKPAVPAKTKDTVWSDMQAKKRGIKRMIGSSVSTYSGRYWKMARSNAWL